MYRILKLKKFDKHVEEDYREKAQEFARRGFRSLGVAIKEDGKDWELLGIMCVFRSVCFACGAPKEINPLILRYRSMSDPPRGDTAAVRFSFPDHLRRALILHPCLFQTIGEAQGLGIHIKMLTGDAVRITYPFLRDLRLIFEFFLQQCL